MYSVVDDPIIRLPERINQTYIILAKYSRCFSQETPYLFVL